MTSADRPFAWPELISLVVFDFDGVMTDNRVLVFDDGREAVMCNRGDGLGIDHLRAAGIAMVILSTERNPVVAMRARKLKLPVLHGLADKAATLVALLQKLSVPPAEVAYIGNDTNDLGCLKLVGLPIAVADAHADIASAVRLTLDRNGGDGAVRQFADLLLHAVAQGHTSLRTDVIQRISQLEGLET
jgi:YrbI family 3-deoxy-D-manno-octulosonate 8-phosphate phosphatase